MDRNRYLFDFDDDKYRNESFNIAIALLVYLPTLFFVPYSANIILFAFFIIFKKNPINLDARDITLGLFVLLVLINLMLGISSYSGGNQGFILAILFVFFNVWIGRGLNFSILKYLLWFTTGEALVVLSEVATGHRYFFTAQAQLAVTGDGSDSEGLLYFLRPFGLSENSSAVSLKVMLGIFILIAFWPRFKHAKLILTTLILATICTFNRTVMGTLVFWGLWLYARWLWRIRRRPGRWMPHLALWVGIFGVGYFVAGDIIFQLTRGSSNLQSNLAGRPFIWSETIDFISNHPIFGNHSFPFRTQNVVGHVAHAHNSFLQVFATHGLIGALLILYPLLFLTRSNLPYVAAIYLYSMTQYGLFWNFSYLDMMLYFFIGPAFPALLESGDTERRVF